MTHCEYFQDVILTDYIDNQLSIAKKKELDNHLMTCFSCRMFADNVMKDLKVLNEIKPVEADPFLWQQLKRRIERDSNLVPVQVGKVDLVGGFLLNFKPYVISFCLFVVLGFGLIVKQNIATHEPYLSYVFASDAQGTEDDKLSIETYFL